MTFDHFYVMVGEGLNAVVMTLCYDMESVGL